MTSKDFAVEVEHLCKSYATVRAVEDMCFTVNPGEIFGLLGPNGAGKTTTIRMILDIIKPTSGRVTVLGAPMSEATKARIGYLPEERGLYDDMSVLETVVFMGRLKGLSRAVAVARAETYLREVELWEARNRRIKALSRGMNQKAQFVAATLHEPELIIIDEPFSGLDPVNTRLVKKLLYRMRDRGAAIIMSTHQMHQVEEMCHRILLVDQGRRVLYGPLDEIRAQFTDNTVEVELGGDVGELPGVEHMVVDGGVYRMSLEAGVQPDQLLRTLVALPGVNVERFERVQASLDEIFVRVVGHGFEAEELTN